MNGPKVIFTLPIDIPPFGQVKITETVVNSWIVMAFLVLLSIFLTHNMKKVPKGKQCLVEKGYLMLQNLVKNTMGEDKLGFVPYIGTLMMFSAVGSLSSMTGLRPLTADLNTTLGWALVTFMLVQVNNIRRHGVGGWLKSFVQPVPFLLPSNIISEVANPISMSFRHFGNIASGLVVTNLVYTGLAALTSIITGGWATVPFLQLGIPAVLSVYFDLLASCLQAFIFCMLTMVFVSMAMDD